MEEESKDEVDIPEKREQDADITVETLDEINYDNSIEDSKDLNDVKVVEPDTSESQSKSELSESSIPIQVENTPEFVKEAEAVVSVLDEVVKNFEAPELEKEDEDVSKSSEQPAHSLLAPTLSSGKSRRFSQMKPAPADSPNAQTLGKFVMITRTEEEDDSLK